MLAWCASSSHMPRCPAAPSSPRRHFAFASHQPRRCRRSDEALDWSLRLLRLPTIMQRGALLSLSPKLLSPYLSGGGIKLAWSPQHSPLHVTLSGSPGQVKLFKTPEQSLFVIRYPPCYTYSYPCLLLGYMKSSLLI